MGDFGQIVVFTKSLLQLEMSAIYEDTAWQRAAEHALFELVKFL